MKANGVFDRIRAKGFLGLVRRNELQVDSTSTGLLCLSVILWFAMVVGLLELAMTFVNKWLRDPTPGFFRMNRHIVWIIPITSLIVFVGSGLLLKLVAYFKGRPTPKFAAQCLLFIAVFSIFLPINRLHPIACAFLALGLAIKCAPKLLARTTGFQRLARLSLFPLMAVVGLMAGIPLGQLWFSESLARKNLTNAQPDAPNVLLIVLDTVRADRLSLYGYERDTTPNLARLAKRGVRFNHACSTAPWTLPSHASLMTGRWPHELSANLNGPLDGSYPTLAERFQDRGYLTGGFVANINYCGAETGLDRGFQHYEDHDLSLLGFLNGSAMGRRILLNSESWLARFQKYPIYQSRSRKTAKQIADSTINWIENRGARPFFAFLNFFDAHDPYFPPWSFQRRFGMRPKSDDDLNLIKNWFVANKKTMTPEQIQLGSDNYDNCIAYLDEQLGYFFDELDQRGQMENTIVVITADHGEHFGEHNLFGHASSLYSQEIHVPLLIIHPSQTPPNQSVSESVSLREVAATIHDLAKLGDSERFPGQSLARFWNGSGSSSDPFLTEVDEPVKSAPNHGRSPVFRGAMKSVIHGRDVYIRNGDGVEELYNIDSDPAQMRDLATESQSANLLERFRGLLSQLTQPDGDAHQSEDPTNE